MSTVIVTTQEALNNAIQEALDIALKDRLPEAVRRATTKPFLTKPELMELTGWSSRQVEYKKSKKEIPYNRNGRHIMFPTEEIYAYLDKGYVKPRTKDSGRG